MSDNVLGKRLAHLRKQKHLSQYKMAEVLGMSRGQLANYEQGSRQPDYDTLKRLSVYFDVNIDYLLGHTEDARPLSHLLPNAVVLEKTTRVPVLGTIRAGYPMLVQENIEGYETVDSNETRGGQYFYLRVKGDSMIGSRIHDNDLVYVRKQEEVENGEIAVVLVNGDEATLKRVYYQNGSVILQPDNPKYAPTVIKKGDVKIVGKVQHVKFTP